MCRQYVLSRATSGTTVTSITSIFGTGNTIGVHEDCTNDVYICRWGADDMQMTCVSADDVQMTPGVVLPEIGQLREVCGWHADGMRMTCVCEQHVDDMWTMCGWLVDDMCVCRWCADDMQMTLGVVLHEIDQLRQVCRQCLDDVWMTYVIRRWNLTQNLTLMSSAHCLHVICMRLQPQKYFQLNSRDSSAKKEAMLLYAELKSLVHLISDEIIMSL